MALAAAAPREVPPDSSAPSDAPSPRATRLLLAVCFFLSGGAGLVYEVLWSRHLHTLFGSTTESVAAVLAVFMTGLGLGGHLLGRVADRSPSPMRLYGLLEIGVGLFAVVTPALLGVARLVWMALAPHVDATGASGLALKLLLAALVLVPPATLMGGTLPALVRATATTGEAARTQVGLLYALNTLGAVAGTLGTGFVLIEVLGLSASMHLTAVVNIGIGALVVARARRHLATPIRPVDRIEARTSALRALSSTSSGRYAIAGLFLSGAITMVCEVVFTRVLGLVFGVSSYAFTMVLAVFLCGLGLGALGAQRIARARTPTPADFGVSQIAMAAVAVVAMLAIPTVPRLLMYARQVPDLSFGAVLGVKLLLAICALLPLALVAGLGTPLLLAALASDEDVGRSGRLIGDGYMVNTAGTLLGSLSAGFLLVQHLGTQGTLRAAIVVAALTGIAGLLVGGRRTTPAIASGTGRTSRLVAGLCALLVMALALTSSAWPVHTYLVSDSRLHRLATSRLQLEQRLRLSPSEILFFAEGREATVAVASSGDRTLISNGHPDASDRTDMSTQLLLALVALGVHPQPHQVAVVGFGSGVTADAAARTPGVDHVDVVELERAILDASPAFHHVNHDVEHNPKVRIVRDDARSFLGATRATWDVILSEPSNPWRAGVASLFTADFFRTAAGALNSGGLFMQWMHLYALTPETLRMVLATVLSVFPEVQVWWVDQGNITILASMTPMPLRLDRVRAVLGPGGPFGAELQRYARLGDGEELLGRFLLDTAGVRAFVARGDGGGGGEGGGGEAGPIHTDDLPLLEFEAPRGLFAPDAQNGLRLLAAGLARDAKPPMALGSGELFPEAERWAGVAGVYRDLGQFNEARAAIDRALAVERSPHLLATAAAIAQQAGDIARCEALLLELGNMATAGAAVQPAVRASIAETTARLRVSQRRFEEALAAFDSVGAMAATGTLGAAATGLDGRLGVERLSVLANLRRTDDAMAQAERTLIAASPGAEVGAIEVEQSYRTLIDLVRAGLLDPARAAALVEKHPVEGLPRFPRDKALATLLLSARRPAEALEQARRALSGGAVDLKLLEIEARALVELGRTAEAAAVEEERQLLVPDPEPVVSPLLERGR